jgi:hypothetical protein
LPTTSTTQQGRAGAGQPRHLAAFGGVRAPVTPHQRRERGDDRRDEQRRCDRVDRIDQVGGPADPHGIDDAGEIRDREVRERSRTEGEHEHLAHHGRRAQEGRHAPPQIG